MTDISTPASVPAPAPAPTPEPKKDVNAEFSKAITRAWQGGVAGATAMSIQVVTLMWIRTTVNYQYRYGTSTMTAFKTLWKDGGITRFYRGMLPALAQGPLSRFGDTASNTGTLALLNSMEMTHSLPLGVKTAAASVVAGLFRIFLMPIDTFKTGMQVEGKDGFKKIMTKFRNNGPSIFYAGSIASAAATMVGHYPWFATYNFLDAYLPKYDTNPEKLLRSAFMGFTSSAISDTCSNSIRVLKVYKQASTEALTYGECLKRVIQEDGVMGLMGRGLSTKIIANGLQGLMFSVLWKTIDEKLFGKH